MDNWNRANESRAAARVQSRVDFDSLLKNKTLSGAVVVMPSQFTGTAGVLTRQLLQTPEIQAALNGQNLPDGAGLQIAADGTVSLSLADGRTQTLSVNPETRVLAVQVRAALTGAQG